MVDEQEAMKQIDIALSTLLDYSRNLIKERTTDSIFGKLKQTTNHVYGKSVIYGSVESELYPLVVRVNVQPEVIRLITLGNTTSAQNLLLFDIDQSLMQLSTKFDEWLIKVIANYPSVNDEKLDVEKDITICKLCDWLWNDYDGAILKKSGTNYYAELVLYAGVCIDKNSTNREG